MKTLVISPTYNERKNIQSLVEQVLGPNPDYHLLVVDDNSPDKTAEKVKELQQLYPNLHLEERPGKAGLGTAYLFGFQWALDRHFEAIVQMDADLSHDPKDVPRLVAELENHDLVIGSRYVEGECCELANTTADLELWCEFVFKNYYRHADQRCDWRVQGLARFFT